MTNKSTLIVMVSALILLSGCVTKQEGYVNGTIEITGYALGSNLSSYRVEVGESFDPTNWSTTGIELISNGTSETVNETLARWDTTAVRDGEYTIRLTVIDTNNMSSQDLVYVNVDNIFITSPENGSAVGNNDLIEIKGKVVGLNFVNYSIDYGYGNNPENWSTDGISLANNGTEQVDLDLLAIWNTSHAGDMGEHILRLRVYGSEGLMNSENITVILANYQAGWPQSTNGSVYSSPAVGDLDDDGDLEIVIGSQDGRVYAWHHNGSLVDGWPQNTSGYVMSSPALYDLDGDNDLEIVVGSYDGKVYAWHHNGSSFDGWPKETGRYVKSSPAIGDLDGDGTLEVIVGSMDDKVYIWHSNGSSIGGDIEGDIVNYSLESEHPYNNSFYYTWTITMPGFTSIAVHFTRLEVEYGWDYVFVSDASGNPVKTYTGTYEDSWSPSVEGDTIKITLESDYIITDWGFAIDQVLNGSVARGWPQETGGDIYSSPTLGDLDGNGNLEVVVGSSDRKVYAWNYNGSLLSGWPRNTSGYVKSSPALSDLDGDNDLEVVVGSYGGWVYAWHHSGIPLDGWPKEFGYYSYMESSPAIGDLDGDGILEIILGSMDDNVYVWHSNGSSIESDIRGDTQNYSLESEHPYENNFNYTWTITMSGFTSIAAHFSSIEVESYFDSVIVSDASGNPVKTYTGTYEDIWSPSVEGDTIKITLESDYSVTDWGFAVDKVVNGSATTRWPQETGGDIYSSPALGDLDGDGNLEVVVGSNDGKAYAWHYNGSPVNGWPKETREYIESSPALADLDGDGDLEVILGSYDGKIHVWDEPGLCEPYQIEWGKFRYNEFNTGWYNGTVTNTTITTSTTTTSTSTTSTTSTTTTLPAGMMRITTDESYQSYPAIYGDIIVWHDFRNYNYDIYMYDLSTGNETQVTSDKSDQWDSVIYGNIIVWTDGRNGDYDIYIYNISTRNETQITRDESAQYSPAIYNNKIVWMDYRSNNMDIYMYDLSTGNETQITTDESDQVYPAIHSNKIVWEDHRNGNSDIYLYDLSLTITCPTEGDTDPCDGAVSSFELLLYIDQWKNGEVSDFDLLRAIYNWVHS